MKKKIKMGMLGGGPGSFIGPVHRMAANLDGLIELVCGCFSSDPVKSAQTGEELCLPQNHLTPGLGNKSHKSVALRFLAFGLAQGLDELEYADRVYLR